jgi:hypothetical protein
MGGALKSRIMPARGSNRGAVKAVVNLNPSLAGGAPVDNLLIEALD